MNPVRRYFDWAATAIPDPPPGGTEVPFGNPSSLHAEGRTARKALEDARARCARILGAGAEEIVFTSGGTESNAIALFSLLAGKRRAGMNDKPDGKRAGMNDGKRAGPDDETGGGAEAGGKAPVELLYWEGEHPSIRENAAALAALGIPAAALPSEPGGRVSVEGFGAALAKRRPRLAAVMAVNNETGAINDMAALAAARSGAPGEGGPRIHCDMVQAAGKTPLDPRGWGIDSAALSAHKLGGPRGTGLLWLKKPLPALVRGGGQEGRIRPGTENTAGALALARVLERRAEAPALEEARRGAAERMAALMAALRRTGAFIPIPADRKDEDGRFSPWILQCAFYGKGGRVIPGEVLVRALDERGFAVSTGSACSAGTRKRPVLEGLGLPRETALGGIRISQGWTTTGQDVEELARAVGELLGVL